MGSLTEDPAFLATTFVVIDFETTTRSLSEERSGSSAMAGRR